MNILLTFLLLGAGETTEITPPVNERFANSKTNEQPEFDRHVLPLLGRLGCNGRECHGSFQGRGGFRLSLFGSEFEMDHTALTTEEFARVDTASPSESLILQKPTLATDHEGGKRFEKNSWEYRLLLNWISTGANTIAPDAARLESLTVEPAELLFSREGQKRSLRVIARWSNGDREDVTPLCRFQTNDDSIAIVSRDGLVTSKAAGDTHIVVFYENGIAALPVLRPVSPQHGDQFPRVAEPTKIDQLIGQKLRKLGVVPADKCSDAEFLRRVSLDLTATLPTAAEVREFLADERTDKRNRKVDELLSRPTYTANMTLMLADLTGLSEENLPVGGEQGLRKEKAKLWYDWLHARVQENTAYDEIVRRIVLAVSRDPEQPQEDYYAEMSSFFRNEKPKDFSKEEWMHFFWTRGRFTPPQTLRFSYAFLGVRLECAECHKHPFDQWTQADYQDFQIFFREVNYQQSGKRGVAKELKEKLGLTADQDSGGYKRLFAKLAHEGTTVPWGEVRAANWSQRKPRQPRKQNIGRVITPRLLGGQALITEQYSDPREPLMQWLTDESNPYFARAFVNRIWARYFGVGIVNPPDDMNLANPASNEKLLAWLSEEFIRENYNIKWLHRTIIASDAYQRSWRANDTNRNDERNFSRAIVRRLPAETAYDAILFATATAEQQIEMQTDEATVRHRKIGYPETGRGATGAYALQLFGKPPRKVLCDCERSNNPTLLQTVYLRNDAELLELLERREGFLANWKKQGGDIDLSQQQAMIADAFLRTLSRPPTSTELQVANRYFSEAENSYAAMRDLIWALVNCKEFIVNH